ncbi:MAG: cystathionine gamma-synthase [Bacilli bacterium]|nr:cystathionine gamma-synthase [Bacilli bacterium]
MSKQHSSEWLPETAVVHSGVRYDKATGASSIPIYQTSTFHWEDLDATMIYDYARSGNPTRDALEQLVAELEGGSHGFAFASGMAAITTSLLVLSSGDHLIAGEDIYGGSFRALTQVFSRLGIETSFVDATNVELVAAAIRPNTRAFLLETPSNPTLRVLDLRSLAELAHSRNILTFVDNTFMSPFYQKPLELGIDVVIHSATKFLGGHSDVIGGVAVVKDEQLAAQIKFLQNGFGTILGPQDSWLLIRGIKTLAVRMKSSSETALRLAEWFIEHPKVQKVFYPGLASHPGYDIQMSQASSGGAVLSIDVGSRENVKRLCSALKLPLVAVSLGGVETIVSYPVQMSHAAMPKPERDKRGITEGLLRVSVGLEAFEDLQKDFQAGLDAI